MRDEILAEFKAEHELAVVTLEGRVREQAAELGTLKFELRNVSQSSQVRIAAAEEETALCRARMDSLQGEIKALTSDMAAVVEERDGLLQRERSRVAGGTYMAHYLYLSFLIGPLLISFLLGPQVRTPRRLTPCTCEWRSTGS